MTTATTTHSFCRICESLCGLEVTTDAARGAIHEIRPDDQHYATDIFLNQTASLAHYLLPAIRWA